MQFFCHVRLFCHLHLFVTYESLLLFLGKEYDGPPLRTKKTISDARGAHDMAMRLKFNDCCPSCRHASNTLGSDLYKRRFTPTSLIGSNSELGGSSTKCVYFVSIQCSYPK